MDASYEKWADAFHFSDDLKVLEDIYQAQHQEALKAEAERKSKLEGEPQPQQTEAPASTGDKKFLDQFSTQVAQHLKDVVFTPDILDEYLGLKELQQDNHLMAQQIQSLLERIESLEKENAALLMQEQAPYHHVMGKLYVKTS